MTGRQRCIDCGRHAPTGMCPACVAERRRLAAVHQWAARHEREADRDGRELRVAVYAEVVERGGTLFEVEGGGA